MNYSFTLLGWLLGIVLCASVLRLLFIQPLKHREGTQYPGLGTWVSECVHTHIHTDTYMLHKEARWPLQMVRHMEKKPTGWQTASAPVPGENI